MDLSAGALFTSLGVSTIGLGLFLYGKRETRFPQLIGGLALMGFPYFVSSPAWMLGIAAGLIGMIWLVVRVAD